VQRYRPEEARLFLVDYRRGLLGIAGDDHLIGYATAADRVAAAVEEIGTVLARRLPGPDVTSEQLRDRSWWRGPELYLLVDDYDLVANAASNPLIGVLDHLAQARDIGLHRVLARRTGGASRARYEAVLARIQELSSPTLLMSGDPAEGPLAGSVRPRPLPPGRGVLVTRRGGAELVQTAWVPPPE
jgi:S-DNA-T family DNA segregation ATPase FtsK/SpoIIIE